MTDFTKGPWKSLVSEDDKGNDCRDITRTYSEGFSFICEITGPNYEANAHLIAAAPDLYEALEYVAASFDAGSYNNAVTEKIMVKVRAALAKARGET